jgi:MinD superfamily P-loop ATPase
MVCINKYDTNLEKAKEIETYCRENDLIFMGKIPFDPKVVEIINQRRSIVEADCQAGQAAEEIYQQVMKHLFP